MKAQRPLLLALVLMAAPLPLLAQSGQGGGRAAGGQRGGMMSARALVEQGSVEYLITHAAHLQLSEQQTASFRRIGAAWSTATADAREQIRTSLPARPAAGAAGAQGRGAGQGGAAGGDRQAMMQRMQQLRPVLEKLTADDQTSLDEALALLSATQQAEARKLLEQRAASMRPRRGDG